MINEREAGLIFQALPFPALILKTDIPRFSIAAASRSYLEMTGSEEGVLVNRGFFEALPNNTLHFSPPEITALKNALEEACITSIPQKISYDSNSSSPNDSNQDIRRRKAEITPVLNENGEAEFLIFTPDSGNISEVEALTGTKKEINLTEENLKAFVQSINGIIWECTGDTFQFTYISPHTEKILGYAAAEWYKDAQFWQKHIHPDDREIAVNYCLSQVHEQKDHEFEYRMIASDGQIVWIRDVVSLVKEPGKPLFLRGFMMDITEIKEVAAAGEFERQHKEALINNTKDLIWSINKEFQLLAANNALINSLKQYTGKIFRLGEQVFTKEHLPEEYCIFWNALYHRALQGEAFITEMQSPEPAEKNRLWYETRFNPIYKDNEVTGVACFARDITGKKRSGLELILSNKKLQKAQKLAKLGYWQTDFKTGKLDWSDEVYTIFGLKSSTSDLGIISFQNALHPDDRVLYYTKREMAIRRKGPFNMEHRIVLPDGSIKWVHESAEPIVENGLVTGLEGTVQDITESKLAEAALYQSNERYRYVTMATFDAIWDWDLNTDIIYWGEGHEVIFGHKLSEQSPDKRSWTNHIHPDDRERVFSGIRIIIESDQNNWNAEYRYRKSDGSYAIVQDRGIVIRDEKNKAVRIIGAMQDLTQQKNEENRLRLLESVITHSNDAIMITEAEPINEPGPSIVFVNEAFSRMTGYNADEVLGRSPRILQGPKTDRKELDRMRGSMEKWEACEIEVINYKKNGEEFWINISIVPVADASGWFTHWISIERDVTERRNYVDRLEKQNMTLRDISWMQSHLVRAPLSRLMGLVKVLDPDSGENNAQQAELLGYILISAQELDKILTSIIQTAGKLDEMP